MIFRNKEKYVVIHFENKSTINIFQYLLYLNASDEFPEIK